MALSIPYPCEGKAIVRKGYVRERLVWVCTGDIRRLNRLWKLIVVLSRPPTLMVYGDREKWMFSMQEEMQSLEKNGTWDIIHLPAGKKEVCCKWIFKRKEGSSPSEATRFKVRLVAKGFSQIPGIDYNDVFSPVIKHSSIRAFLGIVTMHNLELEQLDVKTPFLHGDLEEEIYMDQPEGFIVSGKENFVCKLKKLLYGLKQSPRKWYKKFDSFMIANGFKRSLYDSYVYNKFVDGSPIYLLLYVDDMCQEQD
ncbi:hypothetical protein U9M48_023465 [Paspalum notatum var. saurae]|uniref:Reverse transcriptase Ty1/copia-type domain-containing protein n=1 Tax=Paspalum notatum var. saurae TaxID=547442 RepID=A0AAQ3TND4_PASNO